MNIILLKHQGIFSYNVGYAKLNLITFGECNPLLHLNKIHFYAREIRCNNNLLEKLYLDDLILSLLIILCFYNVDLEKLFLRPLFRWFLLYGREILGRKPLNLLYLYYQILNLSRIFLICLSHLFFPFLSNFKLFFIQKIFLIYNNIVL